MLVVKRFLFLWASFWMLCSCSGYTLRSKKNPLRSYHIKTLRIPLFLNRTSFPQLGAIFSDVFAQRISTYEGPDIFFGEKPLFGKGQRPDAVLLGIIEGPSRRREAITTEDRIFQEGEWKTAMGNRPAMYMPSLKKVNLSLRLLVIKNPGPMDQEFIIRQLGKIGELHPKIIIDRKIELTKVFSSYLLTSTSSLDVPVDPDKGGVTNGTKNRGLLDNIFREMAEEAFLDFEETTLNVF